MSKNIEDYFEDKARAGEGSYAIAYALLKLSNEQERLATKLGQLGFDGPGHNMGALEYLGLKVSDIASALENFGMSANISGSLDVNNG
jgi:hypothetical protein